MNEMTCTTCELLQDLGGDGCAEHFPEPPVPSHKPDHDRFSFEGTQENVLIWKSKAPLPGATLPRIVTIHRDRFWAATAA